MKRRVTFITSPKEEIPEHALRLTEDSLEVRYLKAVREERFTFGFDELPQVAKDVLKQTHELYVRFDNGKDFNEEWAGPFPSRLPLGTHVLVVPLGESKMDNLCGFIAKYAGASCASIAESFISLKRFKQFYAPDPKTLSKALPPLSNKICGPGKKNCKDKILALSSASSIDVKYDAISQIVEINALWGSFATGNTKDKGWAFTIKPDSPGNRVEVGVFSRGQIAGPEDISLDGMLAVVGEDAKFSKYHLGESGL
ncbi:hypothetical protein ABW19_dt0209579 [Dactylella cylindrospora]|nr:hypothetical protein ABW19_dt0209579 [Dactylella cylindrospora]